MRIARLEVDRVKDIIDADEVPQNSYPYQYVNLTAFGYEPSPGMFYDGVGFYNKPRLLTKYEFRQLFTMAERVGIDNYESNPNLTAEHKAMLRTMYSDINAAQDVDLTLPDLQSGIYFLEQLGLISPGRATEILS